MSQADRGSDTDLNDALNGSDGSLIRRFRLGEDDAATQLYKRYAERLHRLAQRNTALDLTRRFDAEDVVQSVFRTFYTTSRTGTSYGDCCS
jgi:RNA polymerase sigma-70 factor (ECF subfamily)